jgi:hypothetical protein
VLGHREIRFFLTGGAVLAGFVLAHRSTDDLDLFTTDDVAMQGADELARSVAAELGASLEALHSAPDSRRYLLSTADDSVKLDFVRDRAPQLYEKVTRGSLTMDPVEEIVVNKLCALTGRLEVRDLVDLMFLERAGHRIESYLGQAARKDAGATPATMAWLLSTLPIPEQLPAGASRAELVAFARDLETRLRAAARP